MSSSDQFSGIPQTRDGAPNWAADTDPVGPVTPELALVDPGLMPGGQINHEVTMSSMQFGDAQVPTEGQPAVPLQPIQPLVPPSLAPEVAASVPAQPATAHVAPAVPVADMRDVPLGTLVFRAGLLPEERLEEALQEGMKTGKRLGEILLERGWVSEVDLGRLLAGQKGLPFVELDASAVDPTASWLLHPEKARLHGALPIGFEGGVPVVAVADPSNDLVVENVRRALACEPVLVVAGRDALHRAINHVYGNDAAAQPASELLVSEPMAAAPLAEPQPDPVVEPFAPIAPAEPVAQVAPVVEPVVPVVEPVAPAPPVVPVLPATAEEASVAAQPPPNGGGIWLGPQPDATQQVQPLPPVEPVVQTEPAQQPVVAAQPVVEVAVPEPVVAEPEAIRIAPVAHEPAVPAAPVGYETAVPAAPEPVVEPVVESVPEPAPQAEPEATWAVVLRLSNGERLELGSFEGEAVAIEQARAVVTQVSTEDGWPFVGGRFVRPEAIVSVDLVELEATRWLGSSTRAAALGPEHEPTA